jgi:hypothetical protein
MAKRVDLAAACGRGGVSGQVAACGATPACADAAAREGHGARTRVRCGRGLFAVLATCLAVALGASACKSDVVQPLKRPEDVRKDKDKKTSKGRSKATQTTQTARSRRSTPIPVAGAVPSPTPAEERTPIVIDVSLMWSDKAVDDPEGGKRLPSNGFLQIDYVSVPYPISEVVLEAKGSSLAGVWPEVDLNMYNRSAKKNFFPWPRDYVTTTTFQSYAKKVNPPLPPGTYLITFRYYNDSHVPGTGEDRSVTLRRIELRP